MEFSLSGNALKTLGRSITCLARVGNELTIQASSSQLNFHTLNSSRSAYQSITFKPEFFDAYTIPGGQVQCSVLLKAVCAVLRTPIASIDHLSVLLPDHDAPKVRWTLDCFNGMKKSYWINCNIEPDVQQLSLDRRKLPSNFVVRPRDLNRLLANFQTNLQEITIIATERSSLPPDAASEIGGKAVELRSYIDPTKDSDSSLHTQLWIDPAEEFVLYNHTGDPVDVTFGVKELKAFLSFCEGCEVGIHFYFEKAGEPILMAPKFGLDDGSCSNFDATLVLATMLASQLSEASPAEPPPVAATSHGAGAQAQEGSRGNMSEHPSNHTRIWSELTGSASKSANGTEDRQVGGERVQNSDEQREIQRISRIQISKPGTARAAEPDGPNTYPDLFSLILSLERSLLSNLKSYSVNTYPDLSELPVLLNLMVLTPTVTWRETTWKNLRIDQELMVMLLNTILVIGWTQMKMTMMEMKLSCASRQRLLIMKSDCDSRCCLNSLKQRTEY